VTDPRPLVVQADHTVLLEVQHPAFAEARDRLARFAELEKSPEYVHFYRLSPISVWNAAALGEPLERILGYLQSASRYPVAPGVLQAIRGWYERYGALELRAAPGGALELVAVDHGALEDLVRQKTVAACIDGATPQAGRIRVAPAMRGELKQALIKLGWPVQDRAGYTTGAPLAIELRDVTRAGRPFRLRPYQEASAAAFWAGGTAAGGSGVIVLPCGAGKTAVGMRAMTLARCQTLVLTTNTVAVRQWRDELLDKTTLGEDQIGEYTGEVKQIRPATIATYQILTHRKNRLEAAPHLEVFQAADWGLILYDEVHLLPAPVFRTTAGLQARRRLGLTATLVREDHKEDEVFSLIGPKRFDLGWKELEGQGFLAVASCIEVRVPIHGERRQRYLAAGAREQFRIAALNERKDDLVARLLERHIDQRVLVIGQYLEQLQRLATVLRLPLVTGRTPNQERERLYAAFRRGEVPRLLVSKVGNFAIDLPDASVAIQVSGTFGSRQEEAQRLGRILRPKSDGGQAWFYTLVSEDTCEQEFGAKRQLFLTEQGYRYEIRSADGILTGASLPG
jgi:DNA excision repair protein ERCC-3